MRTKTSMAAAVAALILPAAVAFAEPGVVRSEDSKIEWRAIVPTLATHNQRHYMGFDIKMEGTDDERWLFVVSGCSAQGGEIIAYASSQGEVLDRSRWSYVGDTVFDGIGRMVCKAVATRDAPAWDKGA